RREQGLVLSDFEPDEANQPPILDSLNRPLTEAVRLETRVDAVHEAVTLLASQRPEAVPHDLGIGIDLREHVAVSVYPTAENESLRVKNRRVQHPGSTI